MNRISRVFILLTALVAARAYADDETQTEVPMVVGGQKVISGVGVQSYSEGQPGIIEVKVPADGRKLVITAVRAGTTTLLLIYNSGRQETMVINVYPRSPASIRNELKTLLSGFPGVEIREVGGRLFLDGAVPSEQDIARIDRIVNMYGGQVASFVTVDPSQQRTNIKLDLHFVEFSKTTASKAGVNWPANVGSHLNSQGQPSVQFLYTYDFIAHAATTGQLVVTEDLLPSLDIMAQRGWAKTNNVVSVITTNGGKAVYHTGGEVNVKISTSLGQSTLQKIPYGVILTVQPRLDPQSGLVIVDIDAEQSNLQPVQGQDVPGRVLTSTKTNVHLKVGQSIMLSGFSQTDRSVTGTGIPGLMSVPILGYLFRSEATTGDDLENILFITPTVLDNASADNRQRIEDALKKYESYGSHIVY